MVGGLRCLLSQLPPELRNRVYKYLSEPTSNFTATTSALPLQQKTYEFKHTLVHISPVHCGSTGLLALRRYHFQEADEYHYWLLQHAVELRIKIHFKGRVSTFVQADWDRKIKIHLHKLARKHPWLTKVGQYDIQIFWGAADSAGKSNCTKLPGQISRNLAKTMTLLLDEVTTRKRSHVKITLHLEHHIALQYVMSGLRLGLGRFMLPPTTRQILELEVWRLPCNGRILPAVRPQSRLVDIWSTQDDKPWPLGAESAKPPKSSTGHLVMKKIADDSNKSETLMGTMTAVTDYVLTKLIEDCLSDE